MMGVREAVLLPEDLFELRANFGVEAIIDCPVEARLLVLPVTAANGYPCMRDCAWK